MPVDESGRPYVTPGVLPTGANMMGAPAPGAASSVPPPPPAPAAPVPGIGNISSDTMRLIEQILGSPTPNGLSGPNPVITSGFAHMFSPEEINQYAYQQPKQLYGVGADGAPTQQALDWWKPGAQPAAPIPVPYPKG